MTPDNIQSPTNVRTGKPIKPRGRSAQSWSRFRAHKRGWWSLWILTAIYVISIFANVLCNNNPIWLRVDGRDFFPVFFSYTQHEILGNGVDTRITNYKPILDKSGVRAIMPLFTSGQNETFSAADLEEFRRMHLEMRPRSHAAAIQLAPDFSPLYSFGETNQFTSLLSDIPAICSSNEAIRKAVESRLANENSPALDIDSPGGESKISLAPFSRRETSPKSVRIMVRTRDSIGHERLTFSTEESASAALSRWSWLSPEDALAVSNTIEAAKSGDWIAPLKVKAPNVSADLAAYADFTASMETVSWPFRPVPGHPMGFDSAGRDVFARIFYATRISLTFGLALVLVTCVIGIAAGAVQGYFAGWVDITGQRLTEIWSALPFLYIIILLGNTLGRSFGLLLVCYAIFNWIGVATYTRAEFLRLRTRPFVDAARCQGLSGPRIMFRHILPNALTPVITLIPFSLVGAIGSLTVLDYLGFGLPAGTPSWGALLQEAQSFRSAWWLILYPSLVLFVVMLLGVFIGEGMRDALDPHPYSKME